MRGAVDSREVADRVAAVPKSPTNFRPQHQPLPARRIGTSPVEKPRTGFGHRVGSKQITSYRGRRIVQQRTDANTVRFIVLLSAVMAVSIAISVWLSGVSTQQSFTLKELNRQDAQISRELETMHRNLEEVRSAAEVTRHAAESGQVVAIEPGILGVEADGTVVEQRPANPAESRPLSDINGAPVRGDRATSDPETIRNMEDTIVATPGTESARRGRQTDPGMAPYVSNGRD